MSVAQFDVVDVASISQTGEMVLTISDRLNWSDTVEHQTMLQKKFDAYLAFMESGEKISGCKRATCGLQCGFHVQT
jgi:hypothetical protein